MKKQTRDEREAWGAVKDQMGSRKMMLGKHWSYNLINDPKRLSFVLSKYKFAAKMASEQARILELGCSEGIGAPILSEFAKSYVGVDFDSDAIATARQNMAAGNRTFIERDFLGRRFGDFDVVVSLDVIEHIHKSKERGFFSTICKNLKDDGFAIIGTPNITASRYASRASRIGHVNLFGAERLRETMQAHFKTVIMFGANDELIHTGFLPMSHYLICLGIFKKRG